MAEELQSALRDVRDTLLDNPVSPRVETPADINLHYCRYVAESVADRVGDSYDIKILEDGGRGYVHTWISFEGRHYDAECVDGVEEYRQLPFFRRHPEAAIHVEPVTTNPSSLRHRGKEPLYPESLSSASPDRTNRITQSAYRRYAVVSILLGIGLVLFGLGGEWAIHQHLLRHSQVLETIFLDAEILGELIVFVAPIVFFVLLPTHRPKTH